MKNCLFVGSFNPITKDHLKIAKDLLNTNLIDYLYFLPVNSKKDNLVSIENRLKMINLVIDNKMESINIYNYNQDGLFNFLILEKINIDKKITHLVMGSDLFFKFSTFYRYEDILKKYNLIIIKRDNLEIENLIQEKYFKFKNKIQIVKQIYPGSSTKARENLNKEENNYLDLKVLDYIRKNNLYN